jgi:8-oxo-dGTP pyrophosphatase MutT (NUDIX family)
MTVREDEIVRDDGSVGSYGVVDKPDFALVVPQDDTGFWLVEQYRYPVGRRAWEFPQGSWAEGTKGSPEDLAAAELREETGLLADRMRHLGRLFSAYGFCSQGFDVFHATGLRIGQHAREVSEQDMQQRHVSRSELDDMIRTGLVVDAATVAAVGLLVLSSA